MPTLTFDMRLFSAGLRMVVRHGRRGLEEEMRSQMRGFVREVIRITPPASGKIAQGNTARLAGEMRIQRDLRRVFVPVPLKGTRQVTHLFGRTTSVTGRPPPYEVPAPERWPDVEGEYRRVQGSDKRQRHLTYKRRRWVDVAKFDHFAVRKMSRVGWAAGGWNAIAEALGKVARPQYLRRHKAAPGMGRLVVDGRRILIEFENGVGYVGEIEGLTRRVQYALDQQGRKMIRQIPYLIRAAARQAGLS